MTQETKLKTRLEDLDISGPIRTTPPIDPKIERILRDMEESVKRALKKGEEYRRNSNFRWKNNVSTI